MTDFIVTVNILTFDIVIRLYISEVYVNTPESSLYCDER